MTKLEKRNQKKKSMKNRIVCLTGTRTETSYKKVKEALDALNLNPNTDSLITGGATGVDAHGKRWAEENGINHAEIKAEWGKYGKGAGPIRNGEMVALATEVIGIWDGESKGTRDCLNQAMHLGRKTTIIVDGKEHRHELPTLWRMMK
jgi:hypothetical protein